MLNHPFVLEGFLIFKYISETSVFAKLRRGVGLSGG